MSCRPGSATDQVRVSCRDGVRLATDVYLPVARTTPVPAVLVRTPYGKNAPDSLLPYVAERLTDAGYAVVVQDVRGRGASEGRAVPFVHELDDGADTLDWLVAQRWSNGDVACWGNSYYGFTAWAAAASGHPAVRALVSRLTTPRPTEFSHDGGVLRLGPMVEWLRSTWDGPDTIVPVLDWSTRPLGALLTSDQRDMLQDTSASWQRIGRKITAALGRLPTLHAVGWFDLFQRAQLQDWRSVAAAAGQFLLAGASDHLDDLWTASGAGPDHLVDAAARDAMLDRTIDPVVEFLDACLRGGSGELPSVRWELAGQTGWRSSPAWPPAAVARHTLRLCGPGRLLPGRAAGAAGTAGWEHRPEHLVPMVTNDWWRPLLRQGDARSWLGRDDVCTFSTEAASAPLDLAGSITLHLAVRSTAPVQHVVATLCDVADDGTSRVVLQAARLLSGTDTRTRIPLGDIAFRLPARHRFRLHVASSCFPLYLPHNGAAADPLTTGTLEGSRQELDLGQCSLTLTSLPPHSADREVPS